MKYHKKSAAFPQMFKKHLGALLVFDVLVLLAQ